MMGKSIEDVSLADTLDSYGVWRSGRVARCPFHGPDQNPSLRLYPNQTYYCFGCASFGDSATVVAYFEGCSYRNALAKLGIVVGDTFEFSSISPIAMGYLLSGASPRHIPDIGIMSRQLPLFVKDMWPIVDNDELHKLLWEFDNAVDTENSNRAEIFYEKIFELYKSFVIDGNADALTLSGEAIHAT